MKKVFLLILLIFFKITLVEAKEKIFILTIINNEPITNIDVINEAKYLAALNPNIQELDKKKILSIAKESLIKEKIKKNELSKFFTLGEKSDFLDVLIKNFYEKLKFNNLKEFESYLENFDLSLNLITKKIEIENKWNELIFLKYNNQVEIDVEKLKKQIASKNKTVQEKELYFLYEILFSAENKSKYEEVYKKIIKSINEIGFKNTANLYSISDSARYGGEVGWVNKQNLNKKIIEKIKNLQIGESSEAITIPGGYMILKIQDKKNEKIEKKSAEEELNKLIQIEKNKKLNEFSLIYFNKVKVGTNIINL
tara:strand:- start:252 stop:1184 length:933 start_codon:yes stop_codon:yes gene_type:complete